MWKLESEFVKCSSLLHSMESEIHVMSGFTGRNFWDQDFRHLCEETLWN